MHCNTLFFLTSSILTTSYFSLFNKHRLSDSRILLCLWILVAVLIAISSYFVYRRRKSSRTITVLQRKYEKSEHERLQKQQSNSCLEETLKLNQEISKKQVQEIEQYKQTIEKLQKACFKELISSSRCYQALLILRDENKVNPDQMKMISEAHWDQIIAEIDQVSPEFTKRLSGKYQYLTKNDIHFCCLVKLEFNYSDIALLLSCTTNAVYKRKKAILERMKVEESTVLEVLLKEI